MAVTVANSDATEADIGAEIKRRLDLTGERGGSRTHYTNMFDIPEDPPGPYRWVERRITPHPVRTQIEPIRLENGGSDGPATDLYPVHGLAGAGAVPDPREAVQGRPDLALPRAADRPRRDGDHAAGTAELLIEAAES